MGGEAVTWASWNGQVMPLEEVTVSVLDRGFLFGDAVYETIRVYAGRLWKGAEHARRLEASLAALRIEHDVPRLLSRLDGLLRAAGTGEGSVYIQVTRGVAPRSHASKGPAPVPNELMYVAEIAADPYAAERPTGVAVVTTPDLRWKRPDIKCTNLLPNVIASQVAKDAGAFDALLVKENGWVVEGSRTSLFAVDAGVLVTAPLSAGILPGVTRETVLHLAERLGIPTREQPIEISRLRDLDELFLTGTTTEVLGIRSVDQHILAGPVPGPITLQLHAAYRADIQQWLKDG